ncbi:Thiol-disulfide oxidoreductase ResA [Emticicia aquatica]|uniref:Thiol-disulfide oxidoreductase ResA n=1 Tax=Emticicia aquatica TaxID=1681835 RepID=A0ABM9ATE5_9BACT|nr:TlpA disulfide reductase family protein [Emticicia aquatica]CAH0997294.1 Thiol-disulfide oxidoreductase ResA [Emticicia aquatica]
MKKTFTILSIIYLCFGRTFAQEGAVSESIQIGSIVPDFNINILTKEGSIKKNISDYRGKVVILEFWATYCGPCFPAMDHLAALKTKFPKDLEVINITDEERWKVVNFLKKRPTSMPIAIDADKSINQLFYHQLIPHTIIIDPQGYIKAITSPEEVTEEVIYLARSGAILAVKTKAEFAPKHESATAMTIVEVEDKSFYKIAVSAAKEGVQSQINKKSDFEYEFINCTVPMMYQVLYQTTRPNPNDKACLEVSEQTKYLLNEKQQYSMTLKIPEPMKHRLGEIGMKHLEEIFSVKAKNETRTRKVYALMTNNEPQESNSETGMDMPLKDFLKLLWDTKVVDMPVINESGMSDTSVLRVKEFPKEVTKVSEILQKMGFKLESKITETACLVLYEDKSNN